MILYILFILTVLVCIIYDHLVIEKLSNSEKRFSNTQQLGYDENILYNRTSNQIVTILNSIPEVDYPENTSNETLNEIDELLEFQKNRPNNFDKTILDELVLTNIIKKFTTNEYEVSKIYYFIKNIVGPIVLKIKVKYDRVRPSYLDDRIKPVVENPNHPSYPSGHASESYTIANIMADKYPNRKTEFLELARTFSVNREIGGFHYKSDTEYGRIIGTKIASFYKGNNNILNN
jgi:hypothetical protein